VENSVTVNSGGTLDIATGGTVKIYGVVVSTYLGGVVSDAIINGGTVEFAGNTSANETLTFTGSGGELLLINAAAPSAVGATISGFGHGDEIVVSNTDITQALYTATGATTGTLTLLNGGTTVQTLELSGSSYSGATFSSNYNANGSNQSVITVSSLPAPTVVISAISDSHEASGSSYDSGFSVTSGAVVTVSVNGTALTSSQFANDFTHVTSGGLDTYTATANAFTGSESIAVSAGLTDVAGNIGTAAATLLPIDTTAPTVVISNLSSSAGYHANFTVTTGAVVTVTLNGTALTATQLTNDFTITTSGGLDTYTAKVGAFSGTETVVVNASLADAAGGTGNAAPLTYDFSVGKIVDLSAQTTGTGSYYISNTSTTGALLTGTGGSLQSDTIIGGKGSDTLVAVAGNDVLTGNGGIDKFTITGGVSSITDLTGGDVLAVSSGAIATAALAGAWNATSATVNKGSANLTTAGYAVNLSGVSTGNGFTVTDSGGSHAITLTASALGDSLYGASGDTLLGGANAKLFGGTLNKITAGAGAEIITAGTNNIITGGLATTSADTIYGAAGDTITGGKGIDTFITTGSESINKVGGNEILQVVSGSVNASIGSAWVAGTGSVNHGVVSLNTAANVNLSAVSGGNGFTITDTGAANVQIIGGNDAGDTVYGASGAVITGGSGADSFHIKGAETITNLGNGHDILIVAAGANATAKIVTSGWVAGAGSSNNGSATLSITAAISGEAVNLAALTGAGLITITDKGSANILRAGSGLDTEIFNAGASDTITGGTGADTFNGAANDVFTGGSGVNTYNVETGTETITNLGYGKGDILHVSAGAIANITVSANWVAGAASNNAGTVNLTTDGVGLNLASAKGAGIWNIQDTGTLSTATLKASTTGVDNFSINSLTETLEFAKGDSAANGKVFDTISGLQSGDTIQYSSALSVGCPMFLPVAPMSV
jgi:hypothetical protein